jgi:transposase-like protein
MAQRKRRTKDLKFKVALEALKEDRQVNEIAEEFGVHPQQVRDWKQKLLQEGEEVFSGNQNAEKKQIAAERDQLYQKVGELQIKNDFLKKSSVSRIERTKVNDRIGAYQPFHRRTVPTYGVKPLVLLLQTAGRETEQPKAYGPYR